MTTLTGFGALVGLVLRRDRLRLSLWVVGLGLLVVVSAASLPEVYPDQASIDRYVALFGDNPALVAFAGPGYGFDDPSLGTVLVNETQVFGCLGVALMSIFLLNRHTRAEEDDERVELLRSAVVGRHAPTAAALVVVAAANVVVGLIALVGFVALGYGVTGSVALAASFTAFGLVFTGVTAVAAQVMSSGRATLGVASAALAAAFVVRAVGDIAESWLRWVSPMGWATAVRAFAGEAWWTLGLCLAMAGALVLVAFGLAARRDLGAGLVAPRLGPPSSPRWATSPLGLAFRLQRGALIGWLLGLFLTGVVYGSIGQDVDQLLADNPDFADLIALFQGASITDSYFATANLMLALFASGFAISSALRLRSEESAGRAEPILATPTSRWEWTASHLVITALGSVATVAAAGLGVGAAYAVVTGDATQVARLTGAALAMAPGVLVLAGVAVVLFGLAPRATPAAWAVLAFVVVVGYLGELLRLPGWTRRLSPFEHVPALPAEGLRVLPLVALVTVAGGLTAVGLAAFRRRDLDPH